MYAQRRAGRTNHIRVAKRPTNTCNNIYCSIHPYSPSIDIARLVVPPQQVHLVGQRELHNEQISHALQTAHAAVDVVPQKDKVARSQRHAQPPNVVGEEVQILEVAVDVPEDVGRTLEEGDAGFGLQQRTDAGVELEDVLGELGAVEVRHVGGGLLEHLGDAVDDVGDGGGGLAAVLAGRQGTAAIASSGGSCSGVVVVGQRVEDGRRGDAGVAAHPGAKVGQLLPPGAALGGVLVDVVAVRAEGVVAAPSAGTADRGAGVILAGERRQLVLQQGHLLLEGGDLGIALDEEGVGPIPSAAASDAADAATGQTPRPLGGVGSGLLGARRAMQCNAMHW